MTVLYITADTIGMNTGGGQVTKYETEALAKAFPDQQRISIDRVWINELKISRESIPEPWCWDEYLHNRLTTTDAPDKFRLAHFYAGTFPKTIGYLKSTGCKICYTVAAHDVSISKTEHEILGLQFPYTHLTDPVLWDRYSSGYLDADAIIVPGLAPYETVQRQYKFKYGKNRDNVFVIPHGLVWPTTEPKRPHPSAKFRVGYLGALGPDKGVPYLLQAWERLNYPHDACELVIAGKQATMDFRPTARYFAPWSNIQLAGWQEDVSNFYDSIDVYVQPSATEGFGLEVIEAMAHTRPVICSKNAGAADCVPENWRYNYTDIDGLALLIDLNRSIKERATWDWYLQWREMASQYTWDKIQTRYIEVWKSLLNQS